MADTTAIADAGYTVLWVAHWGVAAPTLPANDWQGNGWTIWQYSNCGNVPGISGCVDLDWFDGLDFAPILDPLTRHRGPDRHDRDAVRRGRTRHGLVRRDRPRRLLREPVAATRILRRSRRRDDHVRVEGGRTGGLRDREAGRRRTGAGRAARPRTELPGHREPRRHRRARSSTAAATRPRPSRRTSRRRPQVEQASPAIRYGWRTASSKGRVRSHRT